MFNDNHFYYKLLRKYVIIFGNYFDKITFIRYDSSGNETRRIKVPIVYGPKEKYISRTEGDPTLEREVQTILPRMSFEITKISYDPGRKQASLHRVAASDTASRMNSAFMCVPYNINFQLSLYAKNTDDANQIIEQILPYFPPDFTVTVDTIPELSFLKDIPLILNDVDQNIEYQGNYDSIRMIYWTLDFTMRVHFFGPITKPKIIRKAITNIFNDPSIVTGNLIRINTSPTGNGDFQIGDTVYQGDYYNTAKAYGIVNEWNKELNKLVIGGAQGQFLINNEIKAVSTNASYMIDSFDRTPLKLVKIVNEPDPIDAMPDDDYGYTTTIQEYPDIVED